MTPEFCKGKEKLDKGTRMTDWKKLEKHCINIPSEVEIHKIE